MSQDERNSLARLDSELAHRSEVFATQCGWGLQKEHLRSGDRAQRAVIKSGDPGNRGSVIESDDDPAAHAHPAYNPEDKTDNNATIAFRRHEVDKDDSNLRSDAARQLAHGTEVTNLRWPSLAGLSRLA